MIPGTRRWTLMLGTSRCFVVRHFGNKTDMVFITETRRIISGKSPVFGDGILVRTSTNSRWLRRWSLNYFLRGHQNICLKPAKVGVPGHDTLFNCLKYPGMKLFHCRLLKSCSQIHQMMKMLKHGRLLSNWRILQAINVLINKLRQAEIFAGHVRRI